MHKLLILLSSLVATGTAAAQSGQPGPITAEAPGRTYEVIVTLNDGGRSIGVPIVTLRDGEERTVRIPGEPYMLELKLRRVPTAAFGTEAAMIDTELLVEREGRWETRISPSFIVGIGPEGTTQTRIGEITMSVGIMADRVQMPAWPSGAQPMRAVQSFVSADDYPAVALKAGEQGTTRVRLNVASNGRVVRCIVTASSGSSALDSTTCRLLTARARFRPALDSAGAPTADEYMTGLVWTLRPEVRVEQTAPVPGGMKSNSAPPLPVVRVPAWQPPPAAPPPAVTFAEGPRPRAQMQSLIDLGDYPASALRAGEQGTTRVELIVAPNGRATGCTVTKSSGSTALDSATCRILLSRARFTPARDTTGSPVESRYSTAIRWSYADSAEPTARP